MPELPEVETTVLGIKPYLEGRTITHIVVRNPRLRIPISEEIISQVNKKIINQLSRRAKYIILSLSEGFILIHLGMSGHLRLLQATETYGKHDHVDLHFDNNMMLRYCDPRRFGLFHYIDENPLIHPLLSHYGPEPLSDAFNASYLYHKTRNKNQPIKSVVMNNEIVVGVGNIYAAESLFLTKLHPQEPSKHLTVQECETLTSTIKQVLDRAIHAGGTTLRDFYSTDGKPGYFSMSLNVYGRKINYVMYVIR